MGSDMLKRTAENAVWLNRYRVRAEILARLITLHYDNLLDRPRQTADNDKLAESIGCWMPCLLVAGIEEPEKLTTTNGGGLQILIAGEDNSNSLLNLIQQLHINLRCCRDFLPQEIFDTLSQLCLHASQVLSLSSNANSVIAILRDIVLQMMTINGQMEQRMAHNHIYRFLKAGELIERADLATRVLEMTEDSAFRESPVLQLVSDQSSKNEKQSGTDNNKRKSTRSALSRQTIRNLAMRAMAVDPSNTGAQVGPTVLPAPGIVDMRVVQKLLQDINQPQSLAFCITELEKHLSDLDPKQLAAKRCRELLRKVLFIDNTRSEWSKEDFISIIDDYQTEVSDMYLDIFDRYMRSETSREINAGNFGSNALNRNAQS